MTRRVFIWGSCVSRDSFEYFADDCELLGYVARQSLISCGNQVENADSVPILRSAFQQRMSEGDLAGSALAKIADKRDQIDLLLLDLCDERLGVLEVADGQYLTRSVERIAAGMTTDPGEGQRLLTFGSSEHLLVWLESVQAVTEQLTSLGLKNRTMVLAPDWALRMTNGEPSPWSFGLTASAANGLFDLYYQAFAELGFVVVGRDVPVVTDAEHKWGPAPFHYDVDTYRRLVEVIERAWPNAALPGLE